MVARAVLGSKSDPSGIGSRARQSPAAKVKFPSKSVVMVMAGYCCDATAAKAVTAGFKVLQQNGTQFTLRG